MASPQQPASDSIPELFNEALAHHRARRFAEAERLYRQVLAMDAQHADSMHLLGVMAFQLGQYATAVGHITQALQLRDVPDYHNNLGNAFKEQGRLEEAVVQYRLALDGDPNYAEAHNNLGTILRRQGKFDEAVVQYEQAIAAAPDFAEAHYNLGNVFKEQRQFDKAVTHYRQALTLRADFAEAHNNLGTVLKDERKLDEAAVHYERALAIKPDSVEFHYNLALALIDQKKIAAALVHLQRCLELNPADRQGVRLLLAGLGKEALPHCASEAHMQQLYARRADAWDRDVGPQSYRGHELVIEAFNRLCNKSELDILDAGCGTGLIGERLRGHARQLEGIDFSLPMLQKAQAKGVYDRLYEADLVSFMTRESEKYDVITCAATLIHFGDLNLPLRAVATALKDDGLFLCTLFPNEQDKNGVAMAPLGGLAQGGCYVHGEDYIASMAEQNDLMVEALGTGIHEYIGQEPVTGLVIALRRRARKS
jgi:predicted TPR repeat methyltransferase